MITRREFLKTVVLVPATAALMPGTMLRAMMAPPGSGVRNLILLDLKGGNDGLNTIVPHGLDGGTYSSLFRPTLGLPANQVLPLSAGIGMHPAMGALKAHYDAGRLAIVQGVGYPQPNFSHEVSEHIWQTGDPTSLTSSGWLARHLASLEAPASPLAVSVSQQTSMLLGGSGSFVPAFDSLSDFVFPYDGAHGSDKDNRRAAYAAIASGLYGAPGPPGEMATTSTAILDLIDLFATVPEFDHVGAYPEAWFSHSLKLTVRLMASGIGMRHFHIPYWGFDTHADQNVNGYHATLLGVVSEGLAALQADLVAAGLAQDTLIVVFSEFGRTVYENGSSGTDHGSVNPVLVLGNAVQGGLTTAHPSMDPADLSEVGELPMVVDMRDVFGTVVSQWLQGDAAAVFPGHSPTTLPILI